MDFYSVPAFALLVWFGDPALQKVVRGEMGFVPTSPANYWRHIYVICAFLSASTAGSGLVGGINARSCALDRCELIARSSRDPPRRRGEARTVWRLRALPSLLNFLDSDPRVDSLICKALRWRCRNGWPYSSAAILLHRSNEFKLKRRFAHKTITNQQANEAKRERQC